jgi:hypothetical protein
VHTARRRLRTRPHDAVGRLVDDRARHVATAVDDVDQPAIDNHVDVDNDIDDHQLHDHQLHDEQHDHDHDHRADH